VKRRGALRIALLAAASVVISGIVAAQPAGDSTNHRFVDVTAGMGVGLHSANSVVNYINLMAQPRPDEKVYDFSSAFECGT
jgi:hypothetical protein